jgi:OOP family OmpA-OmpF porin
MLERPAEDIGSSQAPDARLADALQPVVNTALWWAVRHEPHIWAEALFPVLLPAVRIAIASALRGMVNTLNQVLEEGLSLRRWKWRLEAWRTGKTFAEVLLLRTLVYRVEQILLVDRQTGILLASVAAPDIIPRDSELTSGMLTALQDFLNDSFRVKAEIGVHELHVGDFSLLVETGPRVALAAALRGVAPTEVREMLRAAVDLIHQEFVTELRDFHGDTQPFERSRTILEGCLQSQYHKPEAASYTRVWILAAAMSVALVSWIGMRLLEARRWERAVSALRNAQGIAITHSGRRNGRYILEGLRDPEASPPDILLTDSGIDLRKVSLHFQPYLSLDSRLLVKRARAALNMPDTVSASLENTVLKLAGTAPHSWILQVRNFGPNLAFVGIAGIDADAVTDSDLEALRAEIESIAISFAINSSLITPAQAGTVNILAAKSRQWIDYAAGIGRAPWLEVLGYTDGTGTEEENRALSRQRAEQLAQSLVAAGISPGLLRIEGLGESMGNATDLALQRRAVIRPKLIGPVPRP